MLNNDGENGVSRSLSLSNEETGYNASMVVTDLISCTNSTVDENGALVIVIASGLPKVFYPASLAASATCLSAVKTATTTLPPATSTATSKPKKSGAIKASDWNGMAPLGVCFWVMVVALMCLMR